MIDLASRFDWIDHLIHLNLQFRSDLQWWDEFLPRWNGIGFFKPCFHTKTLVSDTLGSWGCGVYCLHHWLQMAWPPSWANKHIAGKELASLLLAAALWGHDWSGQRVLCKCDNSAVIAVINSGSAKDPLLMQLLRCLFFYAAQYKFSVTARHLHGVENIPRLTRFPAIMRAIPLHLPTGQPGTNTHSPSPNPTSDVEQARLEDRPYMEAVIRFYLSKALPIPPHGPTGQHRSDT